MAERTFAVRAAPPAKRLLDLAKAMHDASQRANIVRHGSGTYILWDKLPNLMPGHQEQWLAVAECALAHIFSDPGLPFDQLSGGVCG